MSNSVKNRAITGILWSAIDRLGGQSVRFAIGIILARILSPAEFGLIGMVTLFVGVSQVFINCGFVEALIRKPSPTAEDLSAVFYLNVCLGAACGSLLYFSAPWIASFYDQPALILLTRIMAADLVIGSFGVIQTMQLTKKLDFRAQMTISLVAIVVSGTVAIVMAANGFGVISLAAQVIVASLLRTSFLWILNGWRPLPYLRFAPLREMFPYGSKLFLSGLLNAAFNEVYTVVIGKLYPPAMLGLYSRARQLQQLPVDNLCGIVGRVSFPVFASIQDDTERLKRALRKALQGISWLSFPLMMGLGTTAKPLVLLLLTEKWVECVPFLQLLCVGGALYPLSLIHLNVLSARGRSDLFLKLEVIKKGIIVLAVAVTYQYGVIGLLYGSVVVGILSLYLNAYYSVRLVGYSYREQFLDLAPNAGLSLLMGAAVVLVSFVPVESLNVRFALQVMTGIVIYMLLSWFWRISSFVDSCEAVAARLPRLRQFLTSIHQS